MYQAQLQQLAQARHLERERQRAPQGVRRSSRLVQLHIRRARQHAG